MENLKKIEKIKSETMYSDPWIRLHRDDVVHANGKKSTYSVVRTKGGVGIVAINKKGEVFLVSQYRYAPGIYSIEIPKGAFNSFGSKEKPPEAAKRELKEETGVTARKWDSLGAVHTLMGYSDDIVHLFLATEISVGDSQPDDNENIMVFTVPLRQIEKIIREGFLIDGKKIHITDATSIAALLLAKNMV